MTTYSTFRTSLASRLGDSSNVHWPDVELKRYTLETLRTWNSISAYFRTTTTLQTVAAQPFYNLPSTLQDGAGDFVLSPTVTDRNLIDDLASSLLESVSPAYAWTGTSQFTLSSLISALERRLNQFLLDSRLMLSVSILPMPSPSIGRITLPTSVMEVHRVLWQGPTYNPLFETDERTLNAELPDWNLNPGTPICFTSILTLALTLQLAPIPASSSSLHLLTHNSSSPLDPSIGVIIPLLDDFTPYIRWGALSDLLSQDGPANDPTRAAHCEQRYREGIELARLFTTVLNLQISGTSTLPLSIFDLDINTPSWQSISGIPTSVALAGPTLLALSPVPDNIYSLSLDIVRSAPIPTLDTDDLSIPPEYLDPLLDYAQYLALFKCGGEEFTASLPLYERFFRAAFNYNSLLASHADNFTILATETKRDRRQRRREVAVA